MKAAKHVPYDNLHMENGQDPLYHLECTISQNIGQLKRKYSY
jgi:hypothetical protein